MIEHRGIRDKAFDLMRHRTGQQDRVARIPLKFPKLEKQTYEW